MGKQKQLLFAPDSGIMYTVGTGCEGQRFAAVYRSLRQDTQTSQRLRYNIVERRWFQ